MRKYNALPFLAASLLLLESCRSTRSFDFQLPITQHAPPATVPRDVSQPTAEPEQAAVAAEPALTASAAPASAGPTTRVIELQRWQRPAAPAAASTAPDTSLTRPVQRTATGRVRETDPFTKTLRLVGGLLIALGVVLIIVAFTATGISGWGALAYLLYGFWALIMSIPFLVFRGKNSSRRLEKQRRRAAQAK